MADPYAQFGGAAEDPYAQFGGAAEPKPSAAATAPSLASRLALRAVETGMRGVDVGKGIVKEGVDELSTMGDAINPYRMLGGKPMVDVKPHLKSSNEDQEAGKTAFKIGSAFVPIPGLEEVGAAAEGSRLLKTAKPLLKRMGGTAVREGLRGTALGTAQTGSVKEGLKQGVVASVAAPVLGELTQGAGALLKKSGQRLYERFLIPGGGPNYNKEVAKDAAEHLIKQGEFALTKGGFTRKIEDRLQEAETAVRKAEDEALSRMGYAPTGAHSYNIRKDTISTDSPIIDIYPEPGPTTSTALTKPEAPGALTTRREVGTPQRGVTRFEEPGAEQARGTRTRYRAERVAETRQGLVDMKPVLQKMRSALSDTRVEGQRIVGYGPQAGYQKQIIQQIRSLCTPNGHMDARSVIKLRRAWDDLLNWERTEGTPLKPGVKKAVELAANALRHEINEQVPGMTDANSAYHFYSGVNKVLKDKANFEVGHRAHGLIGTASVIGGAIAGGVHGGLEEAAGMAMLAGTLDTLWNSGANLTGSAITFDRAGDLLRNGKVVAAINRLATVGAGAARANKQSGVESTAK